MGLGPRKLSNWLTGFETYTKKLGSPDIFCRWAGIAAIAGALERKVWLQTARGKLYPNLYTVLVGPPGVGKTVVSSEVEALWRGLSDHHIAPKSLTKSAIIDSLNDSKRVVQGEDYMEFHSLKIHAGELGVLLPAYESDFMNTLTDIYDGRIYEERRRTKDLHIKINHPQINLLACTTPSYLNGVLPEGAWDQGFLSRTMIVFSGDSRITAIFSEDEDLDDDQFSILRSDLKAIGAVTGKMSIDGDALAALEAWHIAKGPPAPTHPKLVNYLTRRTMHLLKLCMVASFAEGQSKVITLQHYQTALDWLLEAESQIPDVFRAMTSGGDQSVMNDAWYFLFQAFQATKKPVMEHRLIAFLSERVPAYKVVQIVEVMMKSRMMEDQILDSGLRGYVPKTRTPA